MNEKDRSQLTGSGRKLPHLRLTRPNGEHAVPLDAPRRAPVIVLLLHGIGCAACKTYLKHFNTQQNELAAWDVSVVVVTPEFDEQVATPFQVLLDQQHEVESALGIAAPALLIADPWAEIHETHAAGAHEFPDADAIVAAARDLAVRCAECEGEAL